MKKIFYFIVLFFTIINNVLASEGCWIIRTSCENLKSWEIKLNDIPNMIIYATNLLIWIAFTVSVIFIIIWAYKYLVWWMTWQTDQWRSTIIWAVFWATISACAFLIVKLLIDNLL